LYECETWSLKLKEELKLEVSEDMVLRMTFGPKREEVAGGWRRLHNVELHNSYASPDIFMEVKSRTMTYEWRIARMVEIEDA
jgi:hypothetical protein